MDTKQHGCECIGGDCESVCELRLPLSGESLHARLGRDIARIQAAYIGVYRPLFASHEESPRELLEGFQNNPRV